jgi:glutathione synthase/RimK-type ligase-like ATP-grasp enzyme
MRILIHLDKNEKIHSTSWVTEWVNYFNNNNIYFELGDVLNIQIESLYSYDLILYYFDNFDPQSMMFAKPIIKIISDMGIKIFPDYNTIWFYDDKVVQSKLLDSISAEIPNYWFFSNVHEALDWVNKEAKFPIVAKLKSGSGSNNVELIDSKLAGARYIRKIFKYGVSNVPSLFFKTKSNVKSVKNLTTFYSRFKRIPEFVRTRKRAKNLPKEIGYSYFQEFVENKGYDIKVIVVNDKATFFARPVRDGDFRASGGGTILRDHSLINDEVIKSAFQTSDTLKLQCVGFDYVIDVHSNRPKIIEMSYNFNHAIAMESEGYFDRELKWHNEPLNVPVELLRLFNL